MHSELVKQISTATGASPETVAKILVRSKDIAHGDFALPCFFMAKEWKLSPPECSKKLASIVSLPSTFSKAEAVGPYLNFYLERSAFSKATVSEILKAGESIGSQKEPKPTFVIDYSSPNIAKPFHIGHLRTTLIGLALDRIFRHLGYNVVAVNHLGDWGTQFGFVYAGCQVWGKPDPADMDGLVDRYRRANGLRKQQDEKTVPPEDKDKPEINPIAREYFVRLEADDPEATAFWKWALDISLAYYNKVYDRMGARFDHFTGESFYRSMIPKVESDLKAAGILSDSRGALGVDLGKKLGFVRIFTEDGRSLYITRDLATADYRIQKFNPEKIFIVVGNPQELYFRQLNAILEMMKHPAANKVIHVAFGHVPGISTRKAAAGDERISLGGLLDEAHERALAAYRTQVEKKPAGLNEEEVAEAVGLSAIFYDYLARTNSKDFHFDWDTALNFQGDTGPYILYAIARLNSIEAKAKEAGITAGPDFDSKLLTEDGPYALIALLSKFEDTLKQVVEDCEPYHVALYILEVARTFSSIYRDLRVIGEAPEVAKARLSLFIATRNVLVTGSKLIGLRPIDRM